MKPPAYKKDLDLLDEEDLQTIEMKARGLSFDECLEFLCLESSELSDGDRKYGMKIWKRGRALAISTAADKLFAAMSSRGGGVPAMDYLKALSGTFQAEVIPDAGTKTGFSFNFHIPDEDKMAEAS